MRRHLHSNTTKPVSNNPATTPDSEIQMKTRKSRSALSLLPPSQHRRQQWHSRRSPCTACSMQVSATRRTSMATSGSASMVVPQVRTSGASGDGGSRWRPQGDLQDRKRLQHWDGRHRRPAHRFHALVVQPPGIRIPRFRSVRYRASGTPARCRDGNGSGPDGRRHFGVDVLDPGRRGQQRQHDEPEQRREVHFAAHPRLPGRRRVLVRRRGRFDGFGPVVVGGGELRSGRSDGRRRLFPCGKPG